MAVTAYVWVPGETITAAKLNTISDDLLELDAVAGFHDTQFGSITITGTNTTGDATVSAMSDRAWINYMGERVTDVGGLRLSKVNATTVRATRQSAADVGGGVVVCNFSIVDPRG